jgi:hypothetical protein
LLFLGISLQAQTVLQPKQIEMDWKGIIYKKEQTVDFRFHTNGFSMAYNSGKILSYYKTQFYQLELGFLKDYRETRQNKNFTSSPLNGSSSFVFGKQNSLYNIRGAYGIKRYLSEKSRKKGIAVGWTYMAGPSIALLKPYYITYNPIVDNGPNDFIEIKYTEETAEQFLNYSRIHGGTAFTKGILETKIIPGVQGKLAAHFAIGAFDKFVKAIEAGIMMDVYTQKIPIMVETTNVRNNPYFLNLYVNLQFGKRE